MGFVGVILTTAWSPVLMKDLSSCSFPARTTFLISVKVHAFCAV